MSINLSDFTYPMLELFATAESGYYMSVEDAAIWNQTAFGAMIYRSERRPEPWVAYRAGRGFHITKAGRDAWNRVHSRDIRRSASQQTRPLSHYFDPTAYGLKLPQKKEAKPARAAGVHEMPKRNTA